MCWVTWHSWRMYCLLLSLLNVLRQASGVYITCLLELSEASSHAKTAGVLCVHVNDFIEMVLRKFAVLALAALIEF
jgi:hypothetical protein